MANYSDFEAPETDARKRLEKDAMERLADARQHKNEYDTDLREAYFFAAPHRARTVRSDQEVTTKPQDAGELNTSFGMEMSADFTTVIMNAFMPESQNWAMRKPGFLVPKAAQDQSREKIEEQDAAIFSAIAASNFYSECGKGFTPDLAAGTVAMWIDDPHIWDNIHCQAIPIHQLDGCLGPDGSPDFRSATQFVKMRDVQGMLPGVTLPKELTDKIGARPKATTQLKRMFWRLWEKSDDIYWQYVCMVDKIVVKHAVLRGAGSCNLIVGRFNPYPEWFWGNGPLIQTLPELRSHDELRRARTDHVELALRPPISFPDDSFTNLQDGIESGMAYPVRPGTGDDIKPLYVPPPATVALYEQQDIEQRIKRMFFLDFPDQQGKTPPSATQWLDEVTMAQRRIGTPGMPFWREFCAEIFLRFAYLLEQRGLIEPVEVDGKRVPLVPYNPAARAAETQEVAEFARFAELGAQAFPEEWKMLSDGGGTMDNLARKTGGNKIWVKRDQTQIEGAVGLMSQMMGGQAAGAPAIPGAPVEPAPVSNAPVEQRNYMTGG